MIFIVEDEPVLRRSFVEFLSLAGRAVEGFGTAEAALEAARESPPDVIISDLQLPGMGGLELLEKLASVDPSMVRIAVTAHSSTKSVLAAMRSGCYEYLEKPIDLDQLERLVERALSAKRAERELGWLREGEGASVGSALVGQSDAIVALRREIEMLGAIGKEAPPILVVGETGAGKGLVSRLVHRARFGEDAPFIEVNCAALPANLIEAELFGYEKSAFTDAKTAKPGLFEAAENGTIFLDEIGELELSLQPKLLSVVESGRVRRLGGVRDRPISASIIAATNVTLEERVESGTFRADLYHRLAAFTLRVPPLRERGGDAVLLARAFMKESARKYRKALEELSPEAEKRIADNPWPGNVRELRFAMERAVILTDPQARTLSAEHLPGGPAARAEAAVDARGSAIAVALPEDGVSFEELERAILSAALERAGGNVAGAARLLSLTREAMRYRLKKLGISG
jgi:DNA-binding NtrC family response regulator